MVEAAYRRTDYLDKRKPMMADWAKFVARGKCDYRWQLCALISDIGRIAHSSRNWTLLVKRSNVRSLAF